MELKATMDMDEALERETEAVESAEQKEQDPYDGNVPEEDLSWRTGWSTEKIEHKISDELYEVDH